MSDIRVRFAPSPTGPLNIGGIRTALYDYLLAKKHGGTFILRIEDTDQKRFVEGTEEYIIDALHWLGIAPDEGPRAGGDYGPYRQSERKSTYGEYIQKLIDSGHAYYAFDSHEELEAMRTRLERQGIQRAKYDASTRMDMRNSLSLPEAEVKTLLDTNASYTVRLKVIPGETISFVDEIRDKVSFSSDELDDKILLKTDGMPTYHMANIVDDHLMKISHVIRGEEWLSSTPHHILLYRALGLENNIPKFAHLPLLLKPVGKGKLSKRDGAKFGFPVFPMEWNNPDGEVYEGFKEAGFLPEAIINFLAFLGWNPGTEQEIFTNAGLAEAFSLQGVSKGGARFDFDKAKWFNQQYIIHKDDQELAALLAPDVSAAGYEFSSEYLEKFCGLMKERVVTLKDFLSAGSFFFTKPDSFDEKTIRKKFKLENEDHFLNMIANIEALEDFTTAELEKSVKGYIEKNELGFGAILPILRIGVSGTMKGPDIFNTMELIGKGEVIERLRSNLELFKNIKEVNL